MADQDQDPNQITWKTYTKRVFRELDLFSDLYFCVRINTAYIWSYFLLLLGVSLSIKEYPVFRIFDSRSHDTAIVIYEDFIFILGLISAIPHELTEPVNATYMVGEALIIVFIILFKHRKKQLKINIKKFGILCALMIVYFSFFVIIYSINPITYILLHSAITVNSPYFYAMLLSCYMAAYMCCYLRKVKLLKFFGFCIILLMSLSKPESLQSKYFILFQSTVFAGPVCLWLALTKVETNHQTLAQAIPLLNNIQNGVRRLSGRVSSFLSRPSVEVRVVPALAVRCGLELMNRTESIRSSKPSSDEPVPSCSLAVKEAKSSNHDGDEMR